MRVIKRSLQYTVRNVTKGTLLGGSIRAADTSATRRTGLLKHDGLKEGEGLWIVPCEGIHTFFMRFALDVIYLDRERRVRKVVRNIPPWRISVCFSAHSVLEMAVGEIDRTKTAGGDQMEFEPVR